MHELLRIGQIRERALRVGLPFSKLTSLAGLDHSTFIRISAGNRTGNLATFERLTEALIAYEREQLAYLLSLHGAQAKEAA